MTNSTSRTVPALIGLSIVLSVAMFFRFSGIQDHLVFSTDQGRALLAGRNILLGEFILSGPSTSVDGLRLGPLYYYLTAIALWFSKFNPIGPTIMVAFSSMLTSVFLYLFIWKHWKEKSIAVFSGMIYALSPLVSWQARIAIEPTPLPLIVILWLWSTTEAVETDNKKWWVFAGILPLIGIQLNFSAVVLWGVLFALLSVRSKILPHIQKVRIAFFMSLVSGGLLLYKFLIATPTQLSYWKREWLLLTTPDSVLAAVILFILAASVVFFWVLSLIYRWHARTRQNSVRFVLTMWILLSLLAFSLKTVGGDHALALIFLVPAILIPLSITPLLRLKRFHSFSLFSLTLLLLLWSLQSWPHIMPESEQTLQSHQEIITAIKQASENEPYALIYRGHLDIYDAADDHLQYLLWLAGTPPAQAGRIDLSPENQEHWLSPQTTEAAEDIQRTLYIYYPKDSIYRYGPSLGERILGSNFILQVVE